MSGVWIPGTRLLVASGRNRYIQRVRVIEATEKAVLLRFDNDDRARWHWRVKPPQAAGINSCECLEDYEVVEVLEVLEAQGVEGA